MHEVPEPMPDEVHLTQPSGPAVPGLPPLPPSPSGPYCDYDEEDLFAYASAYGAECARVARLKALEEAALAVAAVQGYVATDTKEIMRADEIGAWLNAHDVRTAIRALKEQG
jgi:hypothetical protein